MSFTNDELVSVIPKLRRFALKLAGQPSDAEDLLQTTIIKALENKNRFNTGTALFSWTSKIMFNTFVTGWRRKVRFESPLDPEDILLNRSCAPDQESALELKQVGEAMSNLNHEHRTILSLVCVEGMGYEEASETLGIPVGTVRSRLSRAREQLRLTMEDSQRCRKNVSFGLARGAAGQHGTYAGHG